MMARGSLLTKLCAESLLDAFEEREALEGNGTRELSELRTLEPSETDSEAGGLRTSWLRRELPSIDVAGVVPEAELTKRDDLGLVGTVEEVDSRGEIEAVGCSIKCDSFKEGDECSEPLGLHLVLSFETRGKVSSLRELAPDAREELGLVHARSVSSTRNVIDGERERLNMSDARSGWTSFMRKSSRVLLASAFRLSED